MSLSAFYSIKPDRPDFQQKQKPAEVFEIVF